MSIGDQIYKLMDTLVQGNINAHKRNFSKYGNPYVKATKSKTAFVKYALLHIVLVLFALELFWVITSLNSGEFSLIVFLLMQIIFVPSCIFVGISLSLFFAAFYKLYSLGLDKKSE